MAARSVSLVDKIEFEFQGTIYRNAIAFGDVDGDGGNELVTCNTSGHLYVFKGTSSKPWRVCNDDLGCITTVVIDDVTNCGNSSILCLNTEGNCFIFNQTSILEAESIKTPQRDNKLSNAKGTKSSPSHASDILIKPSFVFELPSNPKMAIVADIDRDDQNEVVICYSNKYVRIFRFKHFQRLGIETNPAKDELQESTTCVKKLPKQSSKDEDAKTPLSATGKQPSKDSEQSKAPSPLSPKHGKKSAGKQAFTFNFVECQYEMLQEFCLPGQIGSVASVKCFYGLIASQPAGGCAVLPVKNQESRENIKQPGNKVKDDPIHISSQDIFYPSSGLRNFNVNSEVIGSIKRDYGNNGLFGLCTLDGNYLITDAASACCDQTTTSRATEHQWFKMSRIENADSNDSLAICSWDGMTHIVDRYFNFAAFNFGENVCGFCAGRYSIEPQKDVQCLCYVTFSNRIVLYHDVANLKEPTSLYNALAGQLQGVAEREQILASLTDRAGNIDPRKIKMLLESAS